MSSRKEQLLRRAAGKKGRNVAITREEKSLRAFLEKMGDGSAGGAKNVITDFTDFCSKGLRLDSLDTLDTSNGTSFDGMFEKCKTLTAIPWLDTSKGTDFGAMFSECYALTAIPELDTSNGTKFGSMLYSCDALTTIPKLDLSNGTTFGYMFAYSKSLTTVPEFDTSNCANFNAMFHSCNALTTVPKLDLSKGTNLSNIFYNCVNLQHLRLYNIRISITIGSGTSYGHLLTVDSLVHTIQELCTVTTTQTLTMGSANLTKIADLYCRIIDDTVEKKTMELCESTAEGAMTLADYASEKGWKFA